jgi:hypothetical protein
MKSTLCVLSAALALAACGGDSDPAVSNEPLVLQEGDVRITSRDNAIDLVLQGDQVIVGLSDSMLNVVALKTDTSDLESDNGFGASVERFVKAKVQGALNTRMSYPVAHLRGVKYEDGLIEFEYKGDEKFGMLEDADIDGRPLLGSFSEADSKRFVDAVQARIE